MMILTDMKWGCIKQTNPILFIHIGFLIYYFLGGDGRIIIALSLTLVELILGSLNKSMDFCVGPFCVLLCVIVQVEN